jgi:hypothetical protein
MDALSCKQKKEVMQLEGDFKTINSTSARITKLATASVVINVIGFSPNAPGGGGSGVSGEKTKPLRTALLSTPAFLVTLAVLQHLCFVFHEMKSSTHCRPLHVIGDAFFQLYRNFKPL